MLVLGGPTTFRGVSNKKGGPVALPRKVLKYYTLQNAFVHFSKPIFIQ